MSQRAPLSGRAESPSRRTVLSAAGGLAASLGIPLTPTSGLGELRGLVSRMTLEEKVGQLFVCRVYGHDATAPDPVDADANLKELGVRTAAELIARYRPGGIIYFTWAHNTRSPAQVAALSDGIQRASLAQPRGLPVLVSTDQEHGAVCRIGRPATLLPGAMAIGAGGSAEDARTLGRVSGRELRAMGVLQDYSPVADVNVNPANPVIGVRSFGSDPRAVARLVAAEVYGYRSAGVAATAKHFPGHGDTAVDSHTGFPVITHTRSTWEGLDAVPFRAAISAGIDAIMTGHLLFPALDPSGDPATLSHPIVTGILREELGFDGVVITDALGMAGVRTKYGDARVPVLALKAGVDQLLDPPDLALAWNAVLTAVRRGELTEARLEESVVRILRLKARLGLFSRPYTGGVGAVGSARHLALADRLAERTTTLVVNDGSLLPLSAPAEVVVVGADPPSPSGTTGPPTAVLAGALGQLGFSATALPTGLEPTDADIARAVGAAGSARAVVVTTYNVGAGSSQRALVGQLLATGRPVVVVAIRNPYDIAQLDGVRAYLATYCWTDVEVRAAARVIAGRVGPRGRLPVAVMDREGRVRYPAGHGLSY